MQRHHNAQYVARKKVQEERVRQALLAAGWAEWFHPEAMPPPRHFKREHRVDFDCAGASADRHFCRLDFVLGYDGPCYAFLEVDEDQHRFGFRQGDGAAISCDAKRMANVHTSLALECGAQGREAPPIRWVRYNPNAWHVDGATVRVPKEERERRLVAFLEALDLRQAGLRVGIGYAFYDATGGALDVLGAAEFPDALRSAVVDLGGLDSAADAPF